jgi:hypothetical protein
VDHLGDRVPGLRVCYLVEYAGSSPAQDSLHVSDRAQAIIRARAAGLK